MIREMLPPARPLDTPLSVSVRVPSARPEGTLPRICIAIVSDIPKAAELASATRVERNANDFVRLIRAARDRTIWIDIDCAGGASDPARTIAAALLAHRNAVHVRIVGRCSSSAVIIAMAGDDCTIARDGAVLLHRARRYFTPEGHRKFLKLPLAKRIAIADGMNAADDEQVALLMQRTGRPLATVRRWLAEDQVWSADEAVSNGFADFVDGSIRGSRADRLRASAMPFERECAGYHAGQAVEFGGRIFVTQRRLARCRPNHETAADYFFVGDLSICRKDAA